MLRRLRWQLSTFYFLAALGLVALLGAGSYAILVSYLQNSTDLALQYKMAAQFRQYGLEVPAELAQAEQAFLENQPHATSPSSAKTNASHSPATLPPASPTGSQAPEVRPAPSATPLPATSTRSSKSPIQQAGSGEAEKGGEDGSTNGESSEDSKESKIGAPGHGNLQTPAPTQSIIANPTLAVESGQENEGYDSELSPVFVIPLDQNRQRISVPSLNPAPLVQDAQASASAMQRGSDLRTSLLPDGRRVRLLTYRVAVPGGPALLQVGRLLGDQDRLARGFLIGLLVLSGLSAALLGLGSWWLSGRTLGPAQRAWDQQQAFISNASHELRTPLTLIRASAEYARRGLADPERQALLSDILHESDYMNRLVDDLLLLSRLDAHRLKLDRARVDLPPLLDEMARQARKLAEGREIQVLPAPSRGAVRADPLRLRQVLLILLDNAIRHTPSGGTIQLEARPLGKFYEIRISDSGSGIPPEHLPHIFERFYQVPGAGGQEQRGNGLGLSIAKALVEAQGGSIRLDSQVGEGTTAVIGLPAVSPD
jgi:signal transduction histidine kinase